MALLKVNFEVLHHDLTFLSSYVEDPPTQFIESDKWDDPKDNPIQVVQGELRDWSAFDAHLFKHFTEHLALKGLLAYIQDLAVKVGCTIFSFFYVNEMEEHKLVETETALVSLVEKIQLLKSELGVPTFTVPEVNIVRVDDQGFIRSLSRNIRELLDRRSGSIDCLKRRVHRITDELEFLGSFIKDWGERRHKHEKLRNVATNIVTVAYRAEYVTDSLMVRDGSTLFHHLLCLIDVLGEMKRIRREVIMVFHDKMGYVTEPKVVDSVRPSTNASISMPEDVNGVGLEDEMQALRSQLLGGSRELNVIPIVGMPGIGKTTLARKLFNDRRIGRHFNCRSFITVSQVYETGDLVRLLLRDVTGDDEAFDGRDIDLRDIVYNSLKRKRFLIVVDDLWEAAAWDDLRRLFPDDNNGSRILITTRLNEVALYATTNDVQNLRLLTPSESWALLEKKIFQQESCPPELVEVGKHIAQQCQGLPLSIVLIANILAETRNEVYWKHVCENIASSMSQDTVSIIEQTYKNIPDHLRQCFLYFGAFPEDEVIPVSKLIRLWTAEGFIQQTEGRNSEDVAEAYLEDLIGRNLVMVSRRSYTGAVKSCRIHDLLHDFCLVKSKQEKFFQLMERYGEVSTPLGGTDHGIHPNYSNVTQSVTCEHRRLCISSNWRNNISLAVSGPLVRSLVLAGERSSFSKSHISALSQNFKLLRVLDLGCINVGNAFPVGLENMVLLRYLEVRGEMTSIPSSIVSLQQLQTFVTIGLSGEVAVPDEIWDLTNLRHLHVDTFASIGAPVYRQGFSGKCLDLSTLSTLTIMDEIDTTLIMRRFPNLEKLKCKIFSSHDSSANTKMLLGLDDLTRLNSLKLIYQGMPKSYIFTFPPVLRRLTLSGFKLGPIQTSTIGMLPDLEVLKLLFTAFEDSEWEIRDDYFPMLKILKLEKPDLEKWTVSDDVFPNLERLELQECMKLEEIPSTLADISSLKEIRVEGCCPSVEKSAMDIRETQVEDYQNTEFQLFISRKEATL